MANSPFFTDATTIASVNAVSALLNTGYLKIYSGTQPTDANTAIGAQVLLSTLTFAARRSSPRPSRPGRRATRS